MIHLYWGDGKGKTTAAMGLALRCAGRGRSVVIAQFLKGSDTGERIALSGFPNITLLPVAEQVPFLCSAAPEERESLARQCQQLLGQAERHLIRGCGLLVLDEICAAVQTGLLSAESVDTLLDQVPDDTEVVLTGREPQSQWLCRADYVTELRAMRHPYDRGVTARLGIEY